MVLSACFGGTFIRVFRGWFWQGVPGVFCQCSLGVTARFCPEGVGRDSPLGAGCAGFGGWGLGFGGLEVWGLGFGVEDL